MIGTAAASLTPSVTGLLMIGMLQILTYMFAFYLVIKGIEVLQIGLASSRTSRAGPIVIGGLALAACVVAAIAFVSMQDRQATGVSGLDLSGYSVDAPRSVAPIPNISSPPDPAAQAEWARGRDARNKGWKWAEDKKLHNDAPCSQLGDTEEQAGCKSYVGTFGDRNQ